MNQKGSWWCWIGLWVMTLGLGCAAGEEGAAGSGLDGGSTPVEGDAASGPPEFPDYDFRSGTGDGSIASGDADRLHDTSDSTDEVDGGVDDCVEGSACAQEGLEACTTSVCVGGQCQVMPIADGASCDDGDLCTLGDLCSGGLCVSGDAVECVDDSSCTTDGCDPDTGACSHLALEDGSSCDDGDPCTVGDGCVAGLCMSGHGVPPECNPVAGCAGSELMDCAGACFPKDAVLGALGDGKCDDGTAMEDAVDLSCDVYAADGGDCGGGLGCVCRGPGGRL